MDMQNILACVLCAVIFGIVGYGIQVSNVNELTNNINRLESNVESLGSDLIDANAVITSVKNDVTNLDRELESKNKILTDKDEVIKTGETANINLQNELTDLITKKDLAEQKAVELEKKIELMEQEELETAAGPEGVIFDDIVLNWAYYTYVADNYDLERLVNEEISFDKGSFVKEYLYVKSKPITSLEKNDLGETTVLQLDENGIVYKYDFETPIPINIINGAEGNDTDLLSITLLGKKMDIVKIDGTSMKVKEGTLKYIKLGETIDYNGKSITLDMITNDMIFVTVDGIEGYVKKSMTKTISGADIYLSGLAQTTGYEGAVVIIGSDVYKEYEYNTFGNDYNFEIGKDGNSLKNLTITYTESKTYLDEEYSPLKSGESFNFLDFLTVNYNGVEEVRYTEYNLRFKKYNDENMVKIETKDKTIKTIKIGDDRTNEFYLDNSLNVYYKDINDEKQISTIDTVSFENGDTITNLDYPVCGYLVFKIKENTGNPFETIKANITSFVSLGEEDKAESTDVKYQYLTEIEKLVGSDDNSVITNYGTIVSNPEDNSENDKLVLLIPDKQVTAGFSIC